MELLWAFLFYFFYSFMVLHLRSWLPPSNGRVAS